MSIGEVYFGQVLDLEIHVVRSSGFVEECTSFLRLMHAVKTVSRNLPEIVNDLKDACRSSGSVLRLFFISNSESTVCFYVALLLRIVYCPFP